MNKRCSSPAPWRNGRLSIENGPSYFMFAPSRFGNIGIVWYDAGSGPSIRRVSTYGRIARHIGHPGAARAVGSALGANPYPLVIPCHREIRETGEPVGYRGGPALKRRLLELEGSNSRRRGGFSRMSRSLEA